VAAGAGCARARNVEAQDADAGSVLNAVRAFLGWRKTQPALVQGAIRFLDAPEQVLAFVREHEGRRACWWRSTCRAG
jgi:alpha-glucosidase